MFQPVPPCTETGESRIPIMHIKTQDTRQDSRVRVRVQGGFDVVLLDVKRLPPARSRARSGSHTQPRRAAVEPSRSQCTVHTRTRTRVASAVHSRVHNVPRRYDVHQIRNCGGTTGALF